MSAMLDLSIEAAAALDHLHLTTARRLAADATSLAETALKGAGGLSAFPVTLTAQMLYEAGDLEQAEARLSALAARAEGRLERAALACVRIMLYVTRSEPARSVEVCLEYLAHEGIHFGAHPSREDVEGELERMWHALGSRWASLDHAFRYADYVAVAAVVAVAALLVRRGVKAR